MSAPVGQGLFQGFARMEDGAEDLRPSLARVGWSDQALGVERPLSPVYPALL